MSTHRIALIFTSISLIVLIGLTSINTVQGQACTLCSQADVENFSGVFWGHMVISGPDITNLDALSDNLPAGVLSFYSLTLINNPVLIDINGISQLGFGPMATFNFAEILIEDNPLLETINFPFLSPLDEYFRIRNNSSLDTINIPLVRVTEITIENNASLVYIGLSADANSSSLTINNNASLENLDGIADYVGPTDLAITNNAQLQYYCGLRERILSDPAADITITGNLVNPTFGEILLEGSCGNFVRGLIGYPTLAEALVDASEHDFIYVERSNTINLPTVFLGDLQNTLVIRPQTTLTFTAPLTNEGIVINHGTLQMTSGATFTNSGVFANTGQLIAN